MFWESNMKIDSYTQKDAELENTDNKTTEFDSE